MKYYSIRKVFHLANRFNIFKKSDGITYGDVSKVLHLFSKKISQPIVEGYIFKSPVGSFQIMVGEQRYLTVNWEKSINERDRLLSEGKTLFNEETNPNGEKWLRHSPHMRVYVWKWNKPVNCGYWRFFPTKGNTMKIGRFIQKFIDSGTLYELDGKYEFY